MVSWSNFFLGEAELECESIVDAETLLSICEDNGIDTSGIQANYYKEEPYWSIKDNLLIISRYICDRDEICSCWTVGEYIENHTR